MRQAIYQLDAFADEIFKGNPAAVCPLDEWLPDATLQAIAAENNLSETAYFVARDGAARTYDLRWFTPALEVDLCGHATLASAYVVMRYLDPEATDVRFHSRSGELAVTRDGDLLSLDFPALPPQREPGTAAVAEALGVAPRELWVAGKAMALLDSEADVRAVQPDLVKVKALPTDGLIVTAPGETCDFVSRYFAPHAGIPEDPVTGSAHCILTPFWSKRLDRTTLKARQISARGGELLCQDLGERVRISGRVAPYLEGTLLLAGRA